MSEFKHAVAAPGETDGANAPGARSRRTRRAAVFAAVALAWFCLDMATKSWVNGFSVGEVIAGPFIGLVRFSLVHNTGMAWGMLGDSTMALGVLSLVVCAGFVVYLFAFSPRASLLETAAIALVVAGGLGNAVDRFTLGYVVDFIDPVFIDFPVFNVADIGVTCGFVLFLLGILLRERHEVMRERDVLVCEEEKEAHDR